MAADEGVDACTTSIVLVCEEGGFDEDADAVDGGFGDADAVDGEFDDAAAVDEGGEEVCF